MSRACHAGPRGRPVPPTSLPPWRFSLGQPSPPLPARGTLEDVLDQCPKQAGTDRRTASRSTRLPDNSSSRCAPGGSQGRWPGSRAAAPGARLGSYYSAALSCQRASCQRAPCRRWATAHHLIRTPAIGLPELTSVALPHLPRQPGSQIARQAAAGVGADSPGRPRQEAVAVAIRGPTTSSSPS